MKNLIISIALLFSITQAHGEITEKYDKFRNYSAQTYNAPQTQSGLGLLVISSYEGTNKAVERENSLVLISQSENWKYLKCHHTSFLVNGKPFKLSEMKYDGTVGRGYVLEYMTFTISTEIMRALGSSKTVEYKICNDEFKFTEEDLKTFIGLVEGAK